MADQPTKSGSEKRQKSVLIGFRVSPEERAEIELAAEHHGVTLGTHCRDSLLKKSRIKRQKKPSLDRVLLAQMLAQLGKAGNNLNQIAKRLNEGKGTGTERIIAALDDLHILKESILKELRRTHDSEEGSEQA